MSKSQTDKTWKTKHADLTSLITEVTGYPWIDIVPNNLGVMIILQLTPFHIPTAL